MSIASFLFEGQVPPAITKTSGASTQYPLWFQEYQKGLIAKADALANQPYAAYPGTRVAPLTPDQTAAYERTRTNVGAGMPEMEAAGAAYTAGGNPMLDPGVFESYKSPYIEGVVNRIGELGERNLRERFLPNIRDEFIRAGQFGSSGQGEFTARALRDVGESVLGQQAQALQAGQEAAMANYQTAQGRQLTAGGNLANLAKQYQEMGLTEAAALEAAGQAQQAQEQRGLDVGYQQFQEQRDYPMSQTNWINQILYGQPLPTTTQQVSTSPAGYYNPSPLQSLVGYSSLMAKGGKVRRYAKGGKVIPFPRRGVIDRCLKKAA